MLSIISYARVITPIFYSSQHLEWRDLAILIFLRKDIINNKKTISA